MENKENLNLINLDNEGLKNIRMSTFDVKTLIKLDKLAQEDYKNKEIKHFNSEDILIIIREFIRLHNDYDALMKYIKSDEKGTMTEYLLKTYTKDN